MNDIAVYVFIGIAVSLYVYEKLSRFFGSMMTFLMGLGLIYVAPDNGWIGYMVMTCGFLMIIYSLMAKPKRKRR